MRFSCVNPWGEGAVIACACESIQSCRGQKPNCRDKEKVSLSLLGTKYSHTGGSTVSPREAKGLTQLRRTSRGAALWVRGAGELLPAPALVSERNSSPRGSATTGRLGRCYEGIPGFAQAHGMGSFIDQHHDLDVTRGVPRFRDTVRALIGKHPEPLARGEGELRWILPVRQPVVMMMMSFICSCRNKK